MVNINIEIPDDLHRQARVAAVVQGTTLKEFVIASLEKSVRQRQAP